MRAVLFAVLVVLACTLSVSASSADWSAPEALWSSDLSASELEARHSEFLMATDASSTGPSSSTGAAQVYVPPVTVQLAINTSTCDTNPNQTVCAFTEAGKAKLNELVSQSFGFPQLTGEEFRASFNSTSSSAGAAGASSTASAGRRLLQASGNGVGASFDFLPSPEDGGVHARKIYAAFTSALQCTTAACQDEVKTKYNLPGPSLSQVAVFNTLKDSVIPGTLQVDKSVQDAGEADQEQANLGDSNARNVESVGGPRNTNIGYYVLGAVLLAFIVAALIYFIVHKKPVAATLKEEPLRRDEVALAPVVAAPPAAHSGVVVNEEQPLAAAGQQQMDYRSVFALKHNVLDKNAEQKAAEEDEHNHNDVHFILHQ